MNELNIQNILKKKILVVGIGKSGLSVMETLHSLNVDVSIQDAKSIDKVDGQLLLYIKSKNIDCYFNETPSDISKFDMIVLSPGVSINVPFVQEAMNSNVEIIGELELAFRIGEGNYVAITGTNGKTTTTTLVGEIFKKSDRKTNVVGNIGAPIILNSVDSKSTDWFVTEVSSFQLETIKYFKPNISAILNFSPDHLDRHGDMKKYISEKSKVFMNQSTSDYLVLNYDDSKVRKLHKKVNSKVVFFSKNKELQLGVFVKDSKILVKNESGLVEEIMGIDDINLLGEHNLENCLAAAAISYFSGVDKDIIREAIREFRGVEHRIEYCGESNGVKYYNDSKGTNIDSTLTAINTLNNNIILIAGGDGKDQDFKKLITGFKGQVKHLVLFGRDKEIIHVEANKQKYANVTIHKDLEDSVEYASSIAVEGDNILLSPACASFDMYENYEQRGKHFKNCIIRYGV